MNLRKIEKKFHSTHLPHTIVVIIFTLFVALLVTVVIAFNGSYNSYERSFAYVGQFCDPTHTCPGTEVCTSTTGAGVCKACDTTNVCLQGCKSPATKDNDCKPYCSKSYAPFGCLTLSSSGGTPLTGVSSTCTILSNGRYVTTDCKTLSYGTFSTTGFCEARYNANAQCVPDKYAPVTPLTSATNNCNHTSTQGFKEFCALTSCPGTNTTISTGNHCFYGSPYGQYVCCQERLQFF